MKYLKLFENYPYPAEFYHLTPTKNMSSIIKNGLMVSYSDAHVNTPGIYLSDTLEVLQYEPMYEGEPCTLLSINPEYLDKNFFKPDDYETRIFLDNNPTQSKKYKGWWNVPWIKSLEFVGQVKYCKDIPPEAIKIIKFDKRGRTRYVKLFEDFSTDVINIVLDGKEYVFKIDQNDKGIFLTKDDKIYQRLDIKIPESENLSDDEFFMSPDVRIEIIEQLETQGIIDKLNKTTVAGDKKVMLYSL